MSANADPKTAVTPFNGSASEPRGEFLNTGAPRNGKVAKLSKELRDLINQMLSQGATSAIIIEKLAGRGVSLNHQNVSNWRRGGYQDWVAEQEWLAQINAERETAADLLASGDETSFHQAVLQLALTQIFQTLRREQLRSDPSNYTRLLNALSRIAREALVAKKYRDAAARENAAELIRRDPKRKLNDDERRAIVRNVDEILGLPTTGDLPAPPPPITSAIEKTPDPTNSLTH